MHTRPSEGPPFTELVDCQLTRRKRHHIVTDDAENVLFRSRWFSDILEWLDGEGQTEYAIVTDRDRYRARTQRWGAAGKD
jgi:hypothetical protein